MFTVVLLIIVLGSLNSMVTVQGQEQVTSNQATVLGETIDVMVIDSECLEEQVCHAWRPLQLIEYYGADWCEPCSDVELSIENIDTTKYAIIQHHPSVLDYSYLNFSNQRYETDFRLIFIPSLVIDGEGLLTGTKQATELNQSLSKNQTEFFGINELNITNSMLNWNTSTNYTLKIWKTKSTSHEFDNRNLSHLAVDYMEINHEQSQLNLTDWLDNWTGRLIFTLESDGIRVLTSLSQSPTGDMDFNSEDQTTGILSKFDDSPKLAIMVFIALFVALLPALVMWKGLQNMNNDESE